MMMKYALLCLLFSACSMDRLTTGEIRIRDPFIHVDQENGKYYMYAQTENRAGSDFIGVEAYTSEDLSDWTQPHPVLTLPDDAGIKWVWAPEIHRYRDRYYLFVTLTFEKILPVKKPVESERWPPMHIRGTYVYHADHPLGPFKPITDKSHTPADWMALDGTLFVEEGTPYMVFCHEWVQTVDGTMDYVQLKEDLSGTMGEPRLMFKASNAPGVLPNLEEGKVTDGCFLYRSPKTDRLFMIWSTFIPGKAYCVLLTHSESGKISGPWKEQKIIYSQNGGHGMIFNALDNRLMMALHQPNTSPMEGLHLYEIIDQGETLGVGNEVPETALRVIAE